MCKFRLSLCYVGALSLFGMPVYAQTPARQTPAPEGVCGVLKEEGLTNGLYGLCVAYCKAHDSAGASSGAARVLANCNKNKKATGPGMPCISDPASVPDPVPVPQACPCWTAAQAGMVDWVLSDGSTAAGWHAPSRNVSVCGADPAFPYINESGSSGLERAFIRVADFVSGSTVFKECQYLSVVQGQIVVNTLLRSQDSTLTAEQLAACKGDVFARQAALGVCQ
jgi:hypothetical protein